jgi:hypothetical protein
MRVVALMLMLLCSSIAFAQESDSLAVENEIDSYENDTTEQLYDDSSDDNEKIEHTTIPPAELESTTNYKAERINIKKFDQKKWKEIVGDKDYEEKPEKIKPENAKSKSSLPWNSEILRIISFTIIIGIVLLIILLITRNVSIDYKLKKNAVPGSLEAPIENIEDFDIHQSLESTIAAGNLRLAVRLYYLGLLKKLNEAGIIKWQKEKTNNDYLNEIYLRNSYFDEVKKLTIAYERVWYGEHLLNLETFKRLADTFEILNQKLNSPL